MILKTAALLAGLGLWAPRVEARPYYAAAKGLSCVACHIAPSGAGMRRPGPKAPGKLTDYMTMGADLRAYFSRAQSSKKSGFALGRTAVYLTAEPRPDLQIVLQYHLDEDKTAQAFGLWRSQGDWPLYVRAGRFWLPYGIQWDDPDNSSYVRALPFAPGSASLLNMAAYASDTGVEVGLAPKKDYFLNLSVTNGKSAGGSDNDDRKATTARAGYIHELFMLGGTFYRDKTGPAGTDSTQVRFGPISWFRLNRVVLLYEGGFGENKPNDGGSSVQLRAHAAELDIDPFPGWLARLRFDGLDPNTRKSSDEVQRYTIGLERMMEWISVEVQYRLLREIPSVPNDQVFLQCHVWF